MKILLPTALLALPPIAYYISIQSTISNNHEYLSNPQYIQIKQKQLQYNRQIKQTFRSGDHLLMKTDYRKTLTIRQYLYGLWYSFFDQWDTAGYVYQNKFDTYALYNQFGEQKVRKFDQLSCMPWLVGLVYQENMRKDVDFGRKLGEIVEKNEGTVEVQPIRQKPLRFINRTNYKIYGDNFQSMLLLEHILSERASNPKLLTTLEQRYETQLQKMMQKMESKE